MEPAVGDRPRRGAAAVPGPARRFDLAMALCDRLVVAGDRRRVAERVSGRVLELGAGTGRTMAFLPGGSRVIGVDLDLGRLRYARARWGARVKLVPVGADMTRLPFADGSFDTVVSVFTFCEVASPPAMLSEARRVLRPGGRLVMLEHVAGRWRLLRAVQRLLDAVTVPAFGEHFTRVPLEALAGSGFTVTGHRERIGGVVQFIDARRDGCGTTGC